MDVLREYLPITIIFLVMLQFIYTAIIQRIRIKKIDPETLVCPKCQAQGATNPRITDMGFEQLDEITISIIEGDIVNVINYDPRVVFATDGVIEDGLSVVPLYDHNTLIVSAELYYVELDLRDRLDLKLEFTE